VVDLVRGKTGRRQQDTFFIQAKLIGRLTCAGIKCGGIRVNKIQYFVFYDKTLIQTLIRSSDIIIAIFFYLRCFRVWMCGLPKRFENNC